MNSNEQARVLELSDQVFQLGKELNILTRLSWQANVKTEFFANHAQKLPKVNYPPYSSVQQLIQISSIEKQLSDSPIDRWLQRHLTCIKNSHLLLANLGTKAFFDYSVKLYGAPTDTLNDNKSSSLDLANQFLELLAPMKSMDLGEPPKACILASTVAERMKIAVAQFGSLAPKVEIVDGLSANALAGAEKVKIRKTACFTDKDIEQLVQHEIYIHVATLLNGRHEKNIKLLGLVHAHTTKTQEGLAVFAEFISGSIDLDRLNRLANRVVAIQMAIDGADFIEVYRFFLEQTNSPDQSFENARRVFRGGVVEGGAPFTKDIVYLDGLLRVHNFMRSAVAVGRADCIPLLFVGRLSIEDLPIISQLKNMGLCAAPVFLPPWVKDLRFLFSYLTYSSFLNSVDMSQINQHYRALLQDTLKQKQ